jgi:hypothetical protein
MSVFDKIQAMIGDVAAEHRQLLSQREKLLQRREDLQSLPLSKADTIEKLTGLIEAGRPQYLEALSIELRNFASKPFGNYNHVPFFTPNSGVHSRVVSSAGVTALMGEIVLDGLKRAVNDIENWPSECGPPIHEREKEMATIDKQLTKVNQQIADLKRSAEQSGVRLIEE